MAPKYTAAQLSLLKRLQTGGTANVSVATEDRARSAFVRNRMPGSQAAESWASGSLLDRLGKGKGKPEGRDWFAED